MSNPIENAQKLGQQLFEIQTSTMTKLASMQQDNLQKYFEVTREFTEKLPQSQSPQSVMELQREMAETLWQNYQQANQNTGELIKEAWDQVGDAYREMLDQGDK